MPRISTDDLVARLLGSQSRSALRSFGGLVQAFESDFTVGELARLIEGGQMESALLGFGRSAGAFSTQVAQSTIRSGEALAEALSGALGRPVAFNPADPRLAELLEQSRFRTIEAITTSSRQAANEALGIARARGLSLRQQAQEVRASLGLTQRQVRAVENYRTALETGNRDALRRILRDRRFDPSVRRALESGTPLSRSQINRMVRRYRDRQRAFRAQTVAETESLRAVHEGQELMVEQAIASGDLDQDDVTSQWFTRRDERVRGSHRSMHRQKRDHGDPFVSGNGVQLRYPGDPNAPLNETARCRCRVKKLINARRRRPELAV